MAEASYKVAGSLNFKRLKNGANISTTAEIKSTSVNRLLEQVRKCRGIEGFINHRLYHIHSSSQNYYYVKDVNQIMADDRTPASIKYKDLVQGMVSEELLKRMYRLKEYRTKMVGLCEYYKFHKEIPRIFAKSSYDTFFDHHDKKRKVEYVVITKKLREEAGEDVKAELEEKLKNLRDNIYEPMLQDLFVTDQFKSAKLKNGPLKTKTQANESTAILHEQLSRMFRDNNQSVSDLRMLSMSNDESANFSRNLPFELGLSQGAPSLRQLPNIVETPNRKVTRSPKQIVLQPSSQHLAKKEKPEVITTGHQKASIAPVVIESLKKISLPGTSSKPTSLGQSKLRSSFSKEIEIIEIKPLPSKMLSQDVILTGTLQLQASSSGVKKGISKALTREPSLKAATSRNRSSNSIKRGLTFSKKSTEGEVKVISLKRENSEFRIVKKNSIELEGNSWRIVDGPQMTDRRSLSKNSYLASQPNTANLNVYDIGHKRVSGAGGSFKSGIKANPSAQKLTLGEGSTKSPQRRELELNASSKNFQTVGKTEPSGTTVKLSNMNNVQNFKVNMDKLLKSSGIMDFNSKAENSHNLMAITSRGPPGSTATQSNSTMKHKYTKSGPENLAHTGGSVLGSSKTLRSLQGSIDANAINLLRQTNTMGLVNGRPPTVKNTQINFYVNDAPPTDRGHTFRINQQPQSTGGRESAFQKKGSLSLSKTKAYLAESSAMEQRGVKLVKKTSHSRNAIKKY